MRNRVCPRLCVVSWSASACSNRAPWMGPAEGGRGLPQSKTLRAVGDEKYLKKTEAEDAERRS